MVPRMATRVVKKSALQVIRGTNRPDERLGPVHVSREQRRDIREQAQGHPFQDHDVTVIVGEHDAGDADGREYGHVEETGASDEELARVRHGAEVGADIDRVGDEQQRHDDLQQPVRIVPAEIAGDAMPRGAAEAGADFLDRHHQRIGQQHRPADAETELRTGLAVGADAGRIVVRRAGDQPWPENADKAPDGTGFDRAYPVFLAVLSCRPSFAAIACR